eukprot:scaffold93778_cov40-Cyclotella_meneghiniana.AAC.2
MHLVVTIPQTDGTEAALTLEANHVTKKTLGSPRDWTGSIPYGSGRWRGRPPGSSQSYSHSVPGSSLWPQLAIYASTDELEKVMGKVYDNALPFLAFNRNITKAYRTLPSDYQGIGLKHWCIEKLGKDTAALLRHWQSDSSLGMALAFV